MLYHGHAATKPNVEMVASCSPDSLKMGHVPCRAILGVLSAHVRQNPLVAAQQASASVKMSAAQNVVMGNSAATALALVRMSAVTVSNQTSVVKESALVKMSAALHVAMGSSVWILSAPALRAPGIARRAVIQCGSLAVNNAPSMDFRARVIVVTMDAGGIRRYVF